MYIVGTLKLTALPGEDDDDDDDDEAGDAAEECNDDEDNGDGMQMPSALEQRVFEEAGAEAEDDKGDDDDASVTSSLEEFVGDAGSLNFEQDIHGAEISPEEASLANQGEGKGPAPSKHKVYHFSPEWIHLSNLGPQLTVLPDVKGAGISRHPAGSFWSAHFPGCAISTARWSDNRSPFRCLIHCLRHVIHLHVQTNCPPNADSWRAQLDELKALL